MGWNNEVFSLLIVTSGSGFTGLFVYSPAPGHGNLIASVAAQAGTDPYGNAYSQGIASYTSGGVAESLLTGGLMQLIDTAFQSAPVTFNVSGSSGNTAAMSITSGAGTEAGAAQSTLGLGDSGAATGLQVTDGADGNTYDTERLTLFNTVAQPITSTTPVVITGLSKAVSARSYEFSGILRIKQNPTTNATQLIGFAGPAVSFCDWYYTTSTTVGTTTSQTTVQGTLTTVGVNPAGVNNELYFTFRGIVTFSAAGTFSGMAAEAVLGDGFTIQPGCILELSPVAAS
jgi:hypothetical protein